MKQLQHTSEMPETLEIYIYNIEKERLSRSIPVVGVEDDSERLRARTTATSATITVSGLARRRRWEMGGEKCHGRWGGGSLVVGVREGTTGGGEDVAPGWGRAAHSPATPPCHLSWISLVLHGSHQGVGEGH